MAIKKSNAKARVKKKSNGKSKNAKAAIVAQEIKFTRLLANNSDKKVTDKALKSLRRWLVARAESKYGTLYKQVFRLIKEKIED